MFTYKDFFKDIHLNLNDTSETIYNKVFLFLKFNYEENYQTLLEPELWYTSKRITVPENMCYFLTSVCNMTNIMRDCINHYNLNDEYLILFYPYVTQLRTQVEPFNNDKCGRTLKSSLILKFKDFCRLIGVGYDIYNMRKKLLDELINKLPLDCFICCTDNITDPLNIMLLPCRHRICINCYKKINSCPFCKSPLF